MTDTEQRLFINSKNQSMLLFIGTTELLFIIFVSVMIFGAKKIPEIARTLGKTMRQLRDATNEIKNEINKSAEVDSSAVKDIQQEIDKVKQELQDPLGRIKRER